VKSEIRISKSERASNTDSNFKFELSLMRIEAKRETIVFRISDFEVRISLGSHSLKSILDNPESLFL
jgi:hypothetical protein